MYHESILQKVGFVAYEMARESALSKLPQNEMLKLVEVQLKKAYEKACKHLLTNGQITQDVYDSALGMSNIDIMKLAKKVPKKINTFKYTISALTFAVLVLLANVFCYDYQHLDIINTVALVALSMYLGFYIGIKTVLRLYK
jgi:hypothetical protein